MSTVGKVLRYLAGVLAGLFALGVAHAHTAGQIEAGALVFAPIILAVGLLGEYLIRREAAK
jgi:hypothetical protein